MTSPGSTPEKERLYLAPFGNKRRANQAQKYAFEHVHIPLHPKQTIEAERGRSHRRNKVPPQRGSRCARATKAMNSYS
jgi:hypothetical protein